MVLVRNWCAEQREDAVAGGLHDVAVVPAHRIDHHLQCGIDNRASLFGIEILLEFRRSLEVREQRGDGLALSFGGRSSIRPFWRESNIWSRALFPSYGSHGLRTAGD